MKLKEYFRDIPPGMEVPLRPSEKTIKLLFSYRKDGENAQATIRRLLDDKLLLHGSPLWKSIGSDLQRSIEIELIEKIEKEFPPGPSRDAILRMQDILMKVPYVKRDMVLASLKKLYDPEVSVEETKISGMALRAELGADFDTDTNQILAKLGRHLSKELSTPGRESILELKVLNEGEHPHYEATLDELIAIDKAPVLQHLGESGFHKCVEAWRGGTVIMPPKRPSQFYLNATLPMDATVFVVQHDWARVMENAEGVEGGEIHLPYEDCVFEFRISGRRVCLSIMKAKDEWRILLNVETKFGWALGNAYTHRGALTVNLEMPFWKGDVTRNLLHFALRHIHAVSVMLDAELAETEVVRAPYRLNEKRIRAGKLPIYDHHVVSLAKRVHYLPRVAEESDLESDHRPRRLHFVRSHLRRFENHTTRVKAHLRGNPDLGFIDKEYRL